MASAVQPPAGGQARPRQADVHEVDSVTIRFAGDSGDGMQLAGTQFTNASAILGNDISTLPDFPAEIRAPAGTLAGVSGFQVHFSSHDIHTPGDRLNTLVAMNPAALKTNLKDLEPGGILIVSWVWRRAWTNRLLSGSPGTTAGPLSPPRTSSARESTRRPPLTFLPP